MESNLQTLIQSGQEDNEDLRTQVYVDTMGPERYNRVRGYGHGVTPDMVSYASSSSSTSISSKRSSNSAMALLMTQNNELKLRDENNNKRISDLENKQSQMFAWLFQRFQPQPQPPFSPGTQQSGQSQPPSPQQSGQSQPPPAYPYAGYNQQPPYPMYLMPMQPMTYMQQPPMPYMQQPPMPYMQESSYQVSVYRPEMAAPCPEFPAGGFAEMLAGVGSDVDLSRMLASNIGPQGREGSVPRSGADSVP